MNPKLATEITNEYVLLTWQDGNLKMITRKGDGGKADHYATTPADYSFLEDLNK